MSFATPARRVAADPAIGELLALADQCVMCGLCVPRCPTYRVAGEEGESPRGRVALIRGALTQQIESTPTLRAHLTNCLTCGLCESACPSQVAFVPLMVGARAILQPARPRDRWFRRLLRTPTITRLLARCGRRVPRFLLARLAPASKLRAALTAVAALPSAAVEQPMPRTRAARGTARGRVALFAGCTGTSVDRDTLDAAMRVIAYLGYDVRLAGLGECCGALDRHAGALSDATRAQARARRSLTPARDGELLVHLNSGCDADVRALASGSMATKSIDGFLLDALNADAIAMRVPATAPTRRVALHQPCTQRRLADPRATASLLARLPMLDVRPVDDAASCCGGGGIAALERPAISTPLRDATIARIAALAPDCVVTANVGCRLRLQAGLAAAGLGTPVQGAVTLLRDILGA